MFMNKENKLNLGCVSNTESKLFCSMKGKGFCPYESLNGECIMKEPCKNHIEK